MENPAWKKDTRRAECQSEEKQNVVKLYMNLVSSSLDMWGVVQLSRLCLQAIKVDNLCLKY